METSPEDRIQEARANLYWAKRQLEATEDKADQSGNYTSYEEELKVLRTKVDVAEARLAWVREKYEVAFGGINGGDGA